MAAPCGLTFPLLNGVPASYVHNAGQQLAAGFAVRLVEVGLADPAGWRHAGGQPVEFLEETLREWQRAAGGNQVGDEHIHVGGGILSDIRTFFWESAVDQDLKRMWVLFDQEGYHDLVEMRHVVTLLDAWHPRLAATVYDCLRSLNRIGFVWDDGETHEWLDMYGDWIIERTIEAREYAEQGVEVEDDWPIEATEDGRVRISDMRLPSLREKPLTAVGVRRILPQLPPHVRTLVEAAVELRAAVEAVEVPFERNHYALFDELELHETSHRVPPVLVLPMERYDAIERAWDEENMAISQMGEPVQPLLAYWFDATDDEDLLWAHRTFEQVVSAYAQAARLVKLLPTEDPRSLGSILAEVEEEDQVDWARVAVQV
jgi:hypothetical protein